MSVPSGRTPLLLCVSFLLTHCTADPVPVDSPDTSSGEPPETGSEPLTPTTGLGSPGSPDTSGEFTGPDDGLSSAESSSSSSSGDIEDFTTASSTEAPLPVCGDAILDEGEECDDGFAGNTMTSACLPDCTAAQCGDGAVHAGFEDCDLGAGNSFEYGGCNELTCKWGPRCGDGQIDAPHEVCDPGDPNGQGEGIAVCDNDCRYEGRVVFLSSVTYDGSLGGLAGADKQCRTLAAKFDAARAYTYRAWLSDAEGSPQSRFAHGPEFDGVPYVLRSGVEVAADFTHLVTYGPWPGIELTDEGEVLTFERVWTNTGVDGFPLTPTDHCDGWTASSNEAGRIGISGLPAMSPDLDAWKTFGQWTASDNTACFKKWRLYCFEN